MPRKTPGDAQRPDNAPWEGAPHLTDAVLDVDYPGMLDPEKWSEVAAGGPPPGPREFWIAEKFGCSRRGRIKRFAMAMYARKGLGARPEHFLNVRKRAGHDVARKNLIQKNVFNEFHVKTRKKHNRTPNGFKTQITADGYYRVIWLEDDSAS